MKLRQNHKTQETFPKKYTPLFLCIFILSALCLLYTGSAQALPKDYEVVSGSADFTVSDESTLTINASNNTIVNYGSFDIAKNEKVIINLPDQSAQILNRVNSPLPTNIMGTLTAGQGLIILINESGIYIAPGANITAQNLVLSTRDITDQNFLDGNYVFERISKDKMDRLLLNEGNIKITEGGFGVLIAGAIENRGIITARAGTIAMAGGNGVRLTLNGNSLISIDITEPVAGTIYDYQGNSVLDQIKNSGTLDAQGGTIMLSADSINDVFRKAINLEGMVTATRLEQKDGHIRLVADGEVSISGKVEATDIAIGTKVAALDINAIKDIKGVPDKVVIEELSAMKAEDLITINAKDMIRVDATIEAPTVTFVSGGSVDTSRSAIISATNLNITAQRFGSSITPVNLNAQNIYIKRLNGDIDIRQSIGIGTSVMITGPPDGEIINISYNRNASQLTLEGGRVIISGNEPISLYGNITFYNFYCDTPGKEIYFEAGKTYTFKGTTTIIGSPDQGENEYHIKLRSQVPGEHWYLDINNDSFLIDRVAIKDASALNYIFIPRGVDEGNNLNMLIDPVWDGGGATYKWSNPYNWDGNVVPNANAVTFNGTSTKDCIVDSANSIASLAIEAGYTGTISLGQTLTITGNFSQAAGTFNETIATDGSTPYNLSVGGTITRTGGTFNGPSKPGGGTTPATRVENETDLRTVCTLLTLNYVQTADITLTLDFTTKIIGTGEGAFTGEYNGYGYYISGLSINASSDYVGFFGRTSGATLSNIHLSNVSVTATSEGFVVVNYIGGLVGANDTSTIKNCYATGTVTNGNRATKVGGLVGSSYLSTITNSYFTGTVTGGDGNYVGGLVGFISLGSINGSYFTGTVSGTDYIAGIAGYNGGNIAGCYSAGVVTGSGYDVGGIAGLNTGDGTITRSYSTANVTGTYNVGGLVGNNGTGTTIDNSYSTGTVVGNTATDNVVGPLVGKQQGTINYSYYVAGTASNLGGGTVNTFGTGADTVANFQNTAHTADVYTLGTPWTFDSSNWEAASYGDYPYLAWEVNVSTVAELEAVSTGDLTARYRQGANINLSGVADFEAYMIGSSATRFTGTFNGNGYYISNLTIINAVVNGAGLFGQISGATLSNIHLSNVNITCTDISGIGGLVGYTLNSSTISNSYATGTITSIGNNRAYVGGLVGSNSSGDIINSYFTGTVESGDSSHYVGGLVGSSINSSSITGSYSSVTVECGSNGFSLGGLVGENSGTITNSYSTGTVTGGSGSFLIGGFVGYNNSGTINSSYASGNVSGGYDIGGLVGYNTGGTINNSYSTGTVVGNTATHNVVGPLVGTHGTENFSYYVAGTATNTGGGTVNTFGTGADTVANFQNTAHTADVYTLGTPWTFDSSNWEAASYGDYPYQAWEVNVSTVAELEAVSTGDLTARYRQGANIDLVGVADFEAYMIGSGDSFTTMFKGTFNGNGYIISNLTISASGNNVGLFGYTYGATFSNIHLSNVNITGNIAVGALVGYNYHSSAITNSYSTGTVTGSGSVGGLVGNNSNECPITNSYSTATVTGGAGSSSVGGLVGYNSSSVITNSYSTGTVTGGSNSQYIGGLVGSSSTNSTIINSYSRGTVTGGAGSSSVGGLVGYNDNVSTINKSYASGNVSGSSTIGGLVGLNGGTINNSYSTGTVIGNTATHNVVGPLTGTHGTENFSYYVAGTATNSGGGTVNTFGTGADTVANFQNTAHTADVYTLGTPWTFDSSNWEAASYGDYPYQAWEVNVSTVAELEAVSTGDLTARYRQGANIDLVGVADFEAYMIGSGTTPFKGTFNGNGYVISNLTINASVNFIGLFGYASGATFSNIHLSNVNVTGGGVHNSMGALVGWNEAGIITNSYSTGTIAGGNGFNSIGGLVGVNNGSGAIINSYSTAAVTSGDNSTEIGGLVGDNRTSSTITNSYATGVITGGSACNSIGGFLGKNQSSTVTNSYAIGTVIGGSGSLNIGGLVGQNGLSTINSSYSSGNVSGGYNIGGLVGDNSTGTTNNSYSTGTVVGNTATNNVVGPLTGTHGTENFSYYVAGTATNSGGGTVNTFGTGADTVANFQNTAHTADVYTLGTPWTFDSSNWEAASYGDYPYQAWEVNVSTVAELEAVSTGDLTARYRQGANIDLVGVADFEAYMIGSSATPFTGTFNGNGYYIDNLTINSASDNIGLFGYTTGATLSGIHLSNVNVTGGDGNGNIGGLVGYNSSSTITSSYSTGAVTGGASGYNIGGLVGYNSSSTITSSYSTGAVTGGTGSYNIGGLVGYNSSSTITNSYSTGAVTGGTGSGDIGGLVGNNISLSNINNSYSMGTVTGGIEVGGLVGINIASSVINNSYSTGTVIGADSKVGGLVGDNAGGIVNNSYSTGTVTGDTATDNVVGPLVGTHGTENFSYYVAGTATNTGGGLVNTFGTGADTVANFQNTAHTADVYTLGTPWTFDSSNWEAASYGDYPYQAWEVNVSTVAELEAVSTGDLSARYRQGANIDLVGVADFEAYMIGSSATPFTGTFNGNGYYIDNLTIDASVDNVGLFGYISGATLSNIRLPNVNVTIVGDNTNIGGLVGYSTNSSTITNSYSSGSVIGGIHNIGGLVGQNNSGTIINSYSAGTIIGADGSDDIGGLVGWNLGDAISNCYSSVNVTGYAAIGGLVGSNAGSITNSYSTGSVTGTSGSLYIGGFVGVSGGTITNSYAAGGVVIGSGGGFTGSDGGTYTNCFAANARIDAQPAGVTQLGAGSSTDFYSTGTLPGGAVYTGAPAWDFVSTWDSFADTYPHLQWENFSPGGYTISGTITGLGDGIAVKLSVNGGALYTAVRGGAGAFTFSGVTFSASDKLLIFVDNNGDTYTGALIGIAQSTANITDITMENSYFYMGNNPSVLNLGSSFANTTLVSAWYNDSDVLYTLSGGNPTFTDGITLYMPAGVTYIPGGSVTAGNIEVDGIFNPAANAVNVSGNWTVAPTATFTTAGNVTFNGSGTQTIITGGTDESHNFYDVTFDNSGTISISTNSINIGHNVTLSRNTAITTNDNNMTIAGSTSGDYTLNITAGTGDISLGAVDIDTLTLTSGDGLTLNGDLTTDKALSFVNVGAITLGTDITITANDLGTPNNITFDSGNVISGPHALAISGSNVTLYQVGNNTANPTSLTVTSAPPVRLYGDLYVDGNIRFNNLVYLYNDINIDTVAAGTDGNILFVKFLTSNNIVDPYDITITAGTGTVDFELSGPVGDYILGAITINSASDVTFGYMTTAASITQVAGSGTTSFNDDIYLTGALNITNNTINIAGAWMNIDGAATLTGEVNLNAGAIWTLENSLTIAGDITLNTGSALTAGANTIKVSGDWVNAGGTFTAGTGTVEFTGTADSAITGSTIFNILKCDISGLGYLVGKNLIFDSTGTQTISTLTIKGEKFYLVALQSDVAGVPANIEVTNSSVQYASVKDMYNTPQGATPSAIAPTNSLNGGGNNTTGAIIGWIFENVYFTGANNWSNASNWSTGVIPGLYDNVQIGTSDIDTGACTLSSAPTTVGSITISTNSSLDLASYDIATTAGLTNNGTLTLQGNQTITGAVNNSATSTVVYNGAGVYLTLAGGNTYGNLTFNGTGSWTPSADFTVNTDINIAAGATLNGSDKTIKLGGDWTNSGTFNQDTSTLEIIGNNETIIYGDNTFHNFKCDRTGEALQKTIIFEAGKTQTIEVASTLTLKGISGSQLKLQSSTDGIQWKIYPWGTNAISDVNVKDSKNLSGSYLLPYPTSSTDSGNNTMWFKPNAPLPPVPPSPVVPVIEPDVPNSGAVDIDEEFYRKKYRKDYSKGKYKTTVIVVEGRVVVADYDESGAEYNDAVSVSGGQETSKIGKVE